MPCDPRVGLLLDGLDQAFHRKAWHGTTLRGSLRGLALARALWRPAPARHNIWELILHTAYWKYAVRRRLEGGPVGGFPRSPSDWPALPGHADASALAQDIALLEEHHAELRATVSRLNADTLTRRRGGEWTVAQLVQGAAAHDLYHAGQIQLLKRLAP